MLQQIRENYKELIVGQVAELFGEDRLAGVGRLGDLFTDFMKRSGTPRHHYNPLIEGASEFVFDSQLPGAGVIPAHFHDHLDDHGRGLLELLELSRPQMAFSPRWADGRVTANLDLMRDLEHSRLRDGEPFEWFLPHERPELRDAAYLNAEGIFFIPDRDGDLSAEELNQIGAGDDYYLLPDLMKWLSNARRFITLLESATISFGRRHDVAGLQDHRLFDERTWSRHPLRIDIDRGAIYVPTDCPELRWEIAFEDVEIMSLVQCIDGESVTFFPLVSDLLRQEEEERHGDRATVERQVQSLFEWVNGLQHAPARGDRAPRIRGRKPRTSGGSGAPAENRIYKKDVSKRVDLALKRLEAEDPEFLHAILDDWNTSPRQIDVRARLLCDPNLSDLKDSNLVKPVKIWCKARIGERKREQKSNRKV